MINWNDSNYKISKYFNVNEALWLPQWNRRANEQDGLNDEIKSNLIILCNKLDQIRDYFNSPINVHCMYRSEEYNKLVHGALNSSHKFGKACDFDISNIDCDRVREIIIKDNLLELYDLRMEKNPGGSWIHLGNDWQEGKNRYFIP